jgi:hypothetical protein
MDIEELASADARMEVDDNYDSSDDGAGNEPSGPPAPAPVTEAVETAVDENDARKSRRRKVNKRVVSDDEEEEQESSSEDDDSDYDEKRHSSQQPSGQISPQPSQSRTTERSDSPAREKRPTSKAPRARKPRAPKKQGGPDGTPAKEKPLTDFDKMLQAMRPQKKKQLTAEEKDALVESTIRIMRTAYQQDLANRKAKRPALEKLRKLDEVVQRLSDQQLLHLFIEKDAGDELVNWLKPGRTQLPNETLRTKLFRVIEKMPFPEHEEKVKNSQIGKILNFYRCHPEETLDNKRLTNAIISRWMDIMKKNIE